MKEDLTPGMTAGDPRAFAAAARILEEGIAQRAFPGASFAILHQNTRTLGAVGRFTYEPDSPAVQRNTIYDLASVTKVLATSAIAMLLHQRRKLKLDTPVASLVPEFRTEDPRREQITLQMLLAHSSGLPAYIKLFESADSPEALLEAAFATPLAADPGTVADYSDIGFIILGAALERIADEPLDVFANREIFRPLGMNDTCFSPARKLRDRIPPTVNDAGFRNAVIQGEVHDENAWVLEGVAGHAGLFGTAADVTRFAKAMLNGEAPFERQTIDLFTRREDSPDGTSRALGWDTPSSPSQSGKYFSARSYGHLGYTGTSLWIDPERQLAVTLLTNRTWPDRSSQLIKEIRPRFHDAIVEALR